MKEKTITKIGLSFQELLRIIMNKKPVLVVMGAKGRSNLAGVRLGSPAEKLFRRCPVPLLRVRDKIKMINNW